MADGISPRDVSEIPQENKDLKENPAQAAEGIRQVEAVSLRSGLRFGCCLMNQKSPNGKTQPPGVYVADTGTALGRGVFAARNFYPGEMVEASPVILLDLDFRELPSMVQRLVFNWSKLCDAPEKFALALGFGSLYNHSETPNLRYSAAPESQALIFTAVQEIKKGQQLTINYNQVPEGAQPRKKDWFKTNQVQKIEI